MNIKGINTSRIKNFGSTIMNMALLASPFSTGAAANSYYSNRKTNYHRNNSYIINDFLSTHGVVKKLDNKNKPSLALNTEIVDDELTLKKGIAIKELVIVDSKIKNAELFSKLSKPGIEILMIEANINGYHKLLNELGCYSGLSSIHVFANRIKGQLILGNAIVNQSILEKNIEALNVYGNSFKEDSELLVYNCALQQNDHESLKIVKGSHIEPKNLTHYSSLNESITGLSIYKGDIDAYPKEGSIALKPLVGFSGTITFEEVKNSGNYRGYTGGTGAKAKDDAIFYTSSNKEYTLYATGSYYSTGIYNNALYSGNQSGRMTFNFNGDATFDVTSVDLKFYLNQTQNFTISSNLGTIAASVPVSNIGVTIPLNTNNIGITKLYVTYDGGLYIAGSAVYVDNLVVGNVTASASNNAPSFNSSAATSVAENTVTSSVILDVNADDGDGGSNDADVTYSISGGLDQALFTIDSDDGELRFKASPNFESPTDNGGNNVYNITVQADDGEASDNTATQDITITVNNVTDSFTTNISVFLEGSYNGTNMNTGINSAIPLNQPYTINGHSGGSAGSIPAGAVDWVLIEFREAATATDAKDATKKGSAAGFLMNDGSIKATDGTSDLTVSVSGNTGGSFFIVVYHRNHLPIMSANAISESGGKYTVDFTSSSASAYNTTSAVVGLSGGKFGMPAGDLNADGAINSTDLGTWRTNNGITFSYSTNGVADFNLDGVINAVDRNDFYLKNAALSFTRQVPSN